MLAAKGGDRHVDEAQLEALVASVTPERVRQMVLEFEPRQPQVSRGTVPLYALLDAFSVGLPLSEASEQSPVDMRLRTAIMAAVAQVEGMTFIEGDG